MGKSQCMDCGEIDGCICGDSVACVMGAMLDLAGRDRSALRVFKPAAPVQMTTEQIDECVREGQELARETSKRLDTMRYRGPDHEIAELRDRLAALEARLTPAADVAQIRRNILAYAQDADDRHFMGVLVDQLVAAVRAESAGLEQLRAAVQGYADGTHDKRDVFDALDATKEVPRG